MRVRRIALPLAICALSVLTAGIIGPRPEPGQAAGPSPDPVAVARKHLEQRAVAQGDSVDASDLALVDYRESVGGRHVHFQQTLSGVPLFGAYVTVNLTKVDDEVTLVTGDLATDLQPAPGLATITGGNAIVIARRAMGVRGALRADAAAEAIYFPADDSVAVQAWQVLLPALDPLGDWLVVVSAVDGTVLHAANLMASDHPDASGQVFDPNPVVSSGAAIPPPTDCDSAENEALLRSEYFSRPLPGIDPGQGQLVGEYVDLTAPGIVGAYKPAGQADEASHVYVYPCDDDRFEEVMVYYHIDKVQRLIQSLGFTGGSAILARPLPAHAHYSDACSSWYGIGGLYFGDGSADGSGERCRGLPLVVDGAEDADIIVHEYGHALQDDQVGILGWGMGEGFADFIAAAVLGDPCMFEWPTAIGTELLGMTCAPSFKDPNLGPFRNLVNDAHYPEDVHPDEHVTGLIWGGALWDLVRAFGADEAARMKVLTLALQSHFYLNPAADLADGAAAVRQANIDLHAGADVAAIDNVFSRRGIIPVSEPDADKDGDGCTNAQEVGINPQLGGRRDPLNFWDFFDTPDPNATPERDKLIRISDIVRVINHFGNDGDPSIDPLSTPPKSGYHPAYDRGGVVGPHPWDLAPADGMIRIADVVAVLAQYGHDCV